MVYFFAVTQVALIIIVLLAQLARRRNRRDTGGSVTAVLDAGRALGGRGGLDPGESMVIPFEQREYRLTAARYAKHGPDEVYLGTSIARPEGPRGTSAFRDRPGAATQPMPRLPHMVLRKESKRDAWGKRLGLNAEPQTGDAEFDDAVYVEHDGDRVGVRHMLAIPDLRARAIELTRGEASVVVNAEGHAVALRWPVASAPPDPRLLREAALRLASFADTIPPVRNLELRKSGTSYVATIAGTILIGAFLVSTVGIAFAVGAAPIDAGFLRAVVAVALALLGATLAVAWTLARGRSRGLALFGWTAAAAAGVVAPLSALALSLVNAVGVSAVRTESVEIARVYDRTSKGRRTCYATLKPWRENVRILKDPEFACAYMKPGSAPKAATVTLGQGRLGWEWIRDVQVHASERR